MGESDGADLGRPRYRSPEVSATGPRQHPDSPAVRAEPAGDLAPGFGVALILAGLGVLLLIGALEYPRTGLSGMIGAGLPVLVGVGAARRGTLVVRRVVDSGGVLEGARGGLWIRYAGQATVMIAAGVLVYRYGGYVVGLLYG